MAYQLQPGLKIVENPARPSVCATEEVFTYPQPSTLNYGLVDPTPCYTVLLPSWRVRVLPLSLSRRVTCSALNPRLDLTRSSPRRMNRIYSLSKT